jgi:hypothetical protein
MLQKSSLRYQVAFYYALFGAGLSILLSTGIYLTVEQIGHRLMDQVLLGELFEHASEPVFVSPNTASIKGRDCQAAAGELQRQNRSQRLSRFDIRRWESALLHVV